MTTCHGDDAVVPGTRRGVGRSRLGRRSGVWRLPWQLGARQFADRVEHGGQPKRRNRSLSWTTVSPPEGRPRFGWRLASAMREKSAFVLRAVSPRRKAL